MVPSYYQIILMFTIQTTQISTYWVSDRGLWYYISANGDTRNYTDAVNYCGNLSGHLATIVNAHQRNFLLIHTGYDKHWVGLSDMQINHSENCNRMYMVWAGDNTCAVDYVNNRRRANGASCSAYTLRYRRNTQEYLTVSDCTMKFGFICQWQCHTLDVVANDVSYVTGVYEQQHYQSNCKYYANTNVYTDLVKSLHAEIVTDNSIICSNFVSYDCPYKWSFSYGDTNKVYTISQNNTPYNSNRWLSLVSNEHTLTDVFFTCRDCIEYEIRFTNGSMESIVTVNKHTAYEYKNESDQRNPIVSFDRDSQHWCYSENGQKLFCLEKRIAPVRYISIYKTETYSLISLSCITMEHSDIEDFTTASKTMQSVTAAQLQSSEPESTEKVSTMSTHTPYISTNQFVNTQDQHSNTETTILDLYSADPQSDSPLSKTENLNTSNGKTYTYIGVAVGVVFLTVIALIIGVVLYRRRNASKGNTEQVTQNLDDVHVITDTNIYTEHPSITDPPTNRATHISVRNGLSDQSNRTGSAPNIPPRSHVQGTRRAAPVPDTNTDPIFQSHNLVDAQSDKAGDHGSNTDAHGSSKKPIYSEVNKLKKPVPPVPTAPVYSQVSHRTKTVNSKRKQGNIQHKRVNCADNNDVYESEKMQLGETQSHTCDNSDEEFSDNELYERDTSAPRHRQTHIRTNVFDNIAFNVDPEGEDIEMVDNNVYAKT